jgi:hypothetical protein
MIDSSIAMGYKPVQIENPMNQLAQLLQIQQAQKQGQLADLNMQTAQRGFDEQNKLRDYFAKGNFDSPDFVRGLYSISPDKAMAYDKTRLDSQKDLAEIKAKEASTAKTNADVVDGKLKQSRQFLDQVQTPEQYLAWHEANHADPVLGPILKARGVTADSARAQIEQALAQPGGFQQLLQRSALGLEKFTEFNKPTYQTQNTGDRTTLLALPGLGGAPTTISTAAINQSPDNAATVANAARTANLTDARTRLEGALKRAQDQAHFDANFNAPQYMQTDAGLVMLPKKLTPGQAPVGQFVAGAGGEALGRPLRDIPASVNTAMITNAQNLQKAKTALALLEGQTLGSMQGDPAATGWKGFAPGAILNRMDPKGVDTRAAIADLGSMVLHDRSGAAVTASEYPRLQPFIPTATDDPVTAAKKLKRFVQVYEAENQAMGDVYSKAQGYRPNPLTGGANATQANGVQGLTPNLRDQADAILRGGK